MSAQLPRSNVRMSPRLSGNPSHSRATTKGHHHSEPPPAAGNVGTKSKSSGREKRRFREAKQRTTAAYFASEEGSSGEDLVLKKGASLQSQPQHHQMKYLSVNADQSGGSCLSSDNNGGGGNGDNTLNPNRLHLQLRKFASPGGAQKGTKSPSDLEADEEDNQEYDSTSMLSQSEMNLQRIAAGTGNSGSSMPAPSAATAAIPPATAKESKEFQSHLQQIRRAGMRDLACRNAVSSSDDDEELGKLLEKERRDKVALMQQLSDQESRISSLEKLVNELTQKLQDVEFDRQKLHRENMAFRKS